MLMLTVMVASWSIAFISRPQMSGQKSTALKFDLNGALMSLISVSKGFDCVMLSSWL